MKSTYIWFFLVVLPLLPLAIGPQWLEYVAHSVRGIWGPELTPKVDIPVNVVFGDKGFIFPDLIQATQLQLDQELDLAGSRFHYTLVDQLEQSKLTGSVPNHDNNYTVVLYLAPDTTVIVHEDVPHAALGFPLSAIHANDLPFFIVQTLKDHLLYADLWYKEPYTATAGPAVDSVRFDLVYVRNGSTSLNVSEIASQCVQSFNFTNQFVDFEASTSEIDISSWKDELHSQRYASNNTFYFQESEESTDGIYNISPHSNADFAEFFDFVLESLLASNFNFPSHPSNNLNVRLGSLLRHRTLDNLQSVSATTRLFNAGYRRLVRDVRAQEKSLVELYHQSKQYVSVST